MKYAFYLIILFFILASCHNGQTSKQPVTSANLDTLLNSYWEERMQLYPLEATANGDNRYNDKWTITISESFRDSLKRFYQKYMDEAGKLDTAGLNDDAKLSLTLFTYEMRMNLESFKYPTHYLPINQFWSPTIDLVQLGSGEGNQPFKTVKDYDDFLKRLSVFPAWVDTAIYDMRKGIKAGWVLPKALVVKVLPQLKAIPVKDTQSIFYGPIRKMPATFSAEDKSRLTEAYKNAIDSIVNPCYTKLYNFFNKEYAPAARSTSGINALPGGADYYNYCIRYWTTTDLSADSIYNIGLQEVNRLEAEMNKIKDETGFKGELKQYFEFLNKDKQFYPFTTAQQVIDSFWNIKKQEDPYLKKLFNHTPKTAFTIRQTEAFRAASASAEYNPASEDGSRPGIFYVPVLDAKKYNATGMVTLFLHEAIPGHHYQVSLQQENKNLPKFRRFIWYGAYGEGWALYAETLGKEMGMYENKFQYFGHLSDAIHRAIRLVVDAGLHSRNMSREDAVKYMVSHERISEPEATQEIERYMAIPGQALSYKMGQMEITALRNKYQQQLGSKFNTASFHDEVLRNGCLPLNILDQQMAKWAAKQ